MAEVICNEIYAYPQVHNYKDGATQVVDFGLTKREWFAGQFLAGYAREMIPSNLGPTALAEECFLLADEMLKAGAKK